MENQPSKILIIDTAWIGDVIFSTALINAASALWPKAKIHMLVAPRGAALVEKNPQISRLWVYDKHGKDKSPLRLLHLGRKLADEHFDVVLCAHPSMRSRFLTMMTKASTRVGYFGFLSSLCFTHRIPNDLAVEPDHVERRMNLLRAVASNVSSASLHVPVLPDAKQRAREYCHKHEIRRPVLGLVIGSAWETKRWPLARYTALAELWHREKNGSILVFGGSREAEEAVNLHRIVPSAIPVINESIPHVAPLLADCDAVAGNDTGITFLAIAVQCKKVAALFGCTQVDYQLPSPHVAITAGVPCCLPRTGHGAHRCKWAEEPWCMSQIPVDRVWSALNDNVS